MFVSLFFFFFFQAEDGIRDVAVTGVQTCALPICAGRRPDPRPAPQCAGGVRGAGAARGRVARAPRAGGPGHRARADRGGGWVRPLSGRGGSGGRRARGGRGGGGRRGGGGGGGGGGRR